jgi:PAS domain S-box-containing protein
MAELIDNSQDLKQALLTYAKGLADGAITREHFDTYESYLNLAGPFEVNWLVDQLVQELPLSLLKGVVAKCIKACGKGLDSFQLPSYPPGTLFHNLVVENQKITKYFEALVPLVKEWFYGEHQTQKDLHSSSIINLFQELLELLGNHYVQLQNELFPRLEQTAQDYRCVQLMWSIQDDVIQKGKEVLGLMESWDPQNKEQWNKSLGRFTVDARSLVYRELRILFPVAYQFSEFSETAHESSDAHQVTQKQESPGIHLPTGTLTQRQLEAILQHLPIDLTFVDHEDKVRFFSESPQRIFPRSPGILGRKVENCHPPKSLDRVVEIVKDLKSGTKDLVQFWMDYRGRKILIEYRALRDEQGQYLGILETTQDITQIQELKGEKRLEE